MDLLYSRYSSPMDLVASYINRGRFGEFVSGFLHEESERLKADAEKNQDWQLWIAYVHCMPDEPFDEWKKRVMKPKKSTRGSDASMTDCDIDALLKKLFPNTQE